MIEVCDLPAEGGREWLPGWDRFPTVLNHPASYARQNPESRFPPLRAPDPHRSETPNPQGSCQVRLDPFQALLLQGQET